MALALSRSNSIAKSDWGALHRRAYELIQDEQIGVSVVVRDANGQQFVNTALPLGQALPLTAHADRFLGVFTSGKPLVTDLPVGAETGKLEAAVVVPVYAGKEVVYSLSIGIAADRLNEILPGQALPADWVSAVSDGAGMIAARTRRSAEFVGQPVVPERLRQMAVSQEAAFESVTKEGIPALVAFSSAPISHGTVSIAIPLATLQAGLKRNLFFLGLGGLTLFAIGGALAWRLGDRIAASVQALSRSALAMLRPGGGPVRGRLSGGLRSRRGDGPDLTTAEPACRSTFGRARGPAGQ